MAALLMARPGDTTDLASQDSLEEGLGLGGLDQFGTIVAH
jgi:hypothetical protein